MQEQRRIVRDVGWYFSRLLQEQRGSNAHQTRSILHVSRTVRFRVYFFCRVDPVALHTGNSHTDPSEKLRPALVQTNSEPCGKNSAVLR